MAKPVRFGTSVFILGNGVSCGFVAKGQTSIFVTAIIAMLCAYAAKPMH
jgi:hypothetical protein